MSTAISIRLVFCGSIAFAALAAPREHGVVELVGRIAAAAGHQNESQQHDGEADGQQDVVAAREGHAGIFGGVVGRFHQYR